LEGKKKKRELDVRKKRKKGEKDLLAPFLLLFPRSREGRRKGGRGRHLFHFSSTFSKEGGRGGGKKKGLGGEEEGRGGPGFPTPCRCPPLEKGEEDGGGGVSGEREEDQGPPKGRKKNVYTSAPNLTRKKRRRRGVSSFSFSLSLSLSSPGRGRKGIVDVYGRKRESGGSL